MDEQCVIKEAYEYIEPLFTEDVTGHGMDHMKRVALWARKLALQEGESPFLAELAAILHDVDDEKLRFDPIKSREDRNRKLREWGLSEEECNQVENAIETVSFRKGAVPETLLGKVLQDADRLDAVGAIGIARTFAFGGAKGQKIHSEDPEERTSIQHFHEKLVHLKDNMHTESGRQEAICRHQTIMRFLEEFTRETKIQEGKG